MICKEAIILAGGYSRRMGYDKAEMKIHGKRLLQEMIETLEQYFDRVIIISNREKIIDHPFIYRDIIPHRGPLSGIHAGLSRLEGQYAYIMACDMPRISLQYIDFLCQSIQDETYDAILAEKSGRFEFFHGLYHRRLIPALEQSLQEEKYSIKYFLQEHHIKTIDEKIWFAITKQDIFVNLNTEEERIKFSNSNETP